VRRAGPRQAARRPARVSACDVRSAGHGGGGLRCPALQVADGAWDLLAAPPGAVETCARSIGPVRRSSPRPRRSPTSTGCARRWACLGFPSTASPRDVRGGALRAALPHPRRASRPGLRGAPAGGRSALPGCLFGHRVRAPLGVRGAELRLGSGGRPRHSGPPATGRSGAAGRAGRRERHISPLSVLGSGRTLGSGRASVSARCGAAYAGGPRNPQPCRSLLPGPRCRRSPSSCWPASATFRRRRPGPSRNWRWLPAATSWWSRAPVIRSNSGRAIRRCGSCSRASSTPRREAGDRGLPSMETHRRSRSRATT
jgi:hypothetical protein